MTDIDLNSLPRYSPWPARLLGLDAWATVSRTLDKVEREYNQDKYARCLEFLHQGGRGVSPDDVKDYEFAATGHEDCCVSLGDRLVVTSRNDARHRLYELLAQTMRGAIEKASTVVELGCGYGYNLWMLSRRFPGKRYIGGEFSANAVALACELYREQPNIRVLSFNFYETPYAWLANLAREGPLVVFTCHALEQLPTAAPFVQEMCACRGLPVTVFHFEPVLEMHGQSLLGLMRQRYTHVNDYNRDLLTALKSRLEVHVRRADSLVFGLNPLNPTSVLEWGFVDEPSTLS